MNKKEYPYNLALDIIWPEELEKQFIENVPEDINETVDFLLNWLDSRRKIVLVDYYKNHKTLAEIGQKLGVSTTRAGSLKFNAISDIRRKQGIKYLLIGKKNVDENNKAMEIRRSEENKQEFLKVAEAERAYLETLSISYEIKKKFSGMPVEELGLEKRTMAVLRRNGLNTVVDLLKFNNESNCSKIFGLGEKGFKELKDIFYQQVGIELKW